MMWFARGLLIFSYGLFAIAAQTLLFREFLTTFEGNDISVGVFFGSWFLWVGLGAILVSRATSLAERLSRHTELLFLLYLPAFLAQAALIIQARDLVGYKSYALFPIKTLVLLSFLLNSPLSLVTGLLFPLFCRWFARPGAQAVARVYILEAAGSFLGGVGVTLLLGFGVSSVTVFFILAFVLTLSVLVVQLAESVNAGEAKLKLVFSIAFCLGIVLCFRLGLDKKLTRYVQVLKWSKLFPKTSFAGAFHTPQAEYLYGLYRGRWLAVRQGSVAEVVGDESPAGQTAAIVLSQNPKARRVLVVGSGFGLCRQLRRLKQLEDVSWAHYDPDYVRMVDRYLPAEFRITDERFHRLKDDVRRLLAGRQNYFDIVVLNLPETTSSVLNRYYTVEFYRRIQDALRAGGILAVRIPGGENIMGTELVNLGASTKMTLRQVFSHLVLKPGESSWFIASDSANITQEPGILRDRFASIEGSEDIFPPDGLLSLYLPDRARKALDCYNKADLPPSLFINTDSRPLVHLYSLLLAAKQSAAPAARFIKSVALAGPLTFLIPVLVFVCLRVAYLLKTKVGGGTPSSFDSSFLVFTAGFIGIGAAIVLMYLYQTYYGSLYLHIGLISSLFMVGLTAGALLVSLALKRLRQVRTRSLILMVLAVHIALLVVIAFWPGWMWQKLYFAAAFVFCGLCSGAYFPLAARELAECGFEPARSGGKLEAADHIGACLGSVLTGLAFIPVLGSVGSLVILVVLLGANLPAGLIGLYKPIVSAPLTARSGFRRAGYILFGTALAFIICSNLVAAAARRLSNSLPEYAVKALAGPLKARQATGRLGDKRFNYYKLYTGTVSESNSRPAEELQEPVGYIFSSADLAPQVRGFGGKINLAIYMNSAGRLVDFIILQSNETPAYLQMLQQWQERLKGLELLRPEPFAGIDAVTGATVSSEAIMKALADSADNFAAAVLGYSGKSAGLQRAGPGRHLPEPAVLYLLASALVSFIVILRGGFWSRLAVLCFNLVVGGLILNIQYSSEQIVTVLSLQHPPAVLSAAFLLAIGVPLMALLFGNIYCGYLCPFGAAQELLGYLVPKKWKSPLPRPAMRLARFVKYVVLFMVLMVFFLCRDRSTLAGDPLVWFFNLRFTSSHLQSWIAAIAIMALVGSLFYSRFWCRYLCPTGAFLSLLNAAAVLKRYLPVKRYGRCEFGLSSDKELDCIYCDKCRYEKIPAVIAAKEDARGSAGIRAKALVAISIVAGILVAAVSVGKIPSVLPGGYKQAETSAVSAGQPRDVDIRLIKKMIEQKRLSDREASYYRKVQ